MRFNATYQKQVTLNFLRQIFGICAMRLLVTVGHCFSLDLQERLCADGLGVMGNFISVDNLPTDRQIPNYPQIV